jgi:hypothetical protein
VGQTHLGHLLGVVILPFANGSAGKPRSNSPVRVSQAREPRSYAQPPRFRLEWRSPNERFGSVDFQTRGTNLRILAVSCLEMLDLAMIRIARPRERPAAFWWKLSRATLQPPRICGNPGAVEGLDSGDKDISEEDQ